jgi:hypothetical protein
LLLLAVFPLDPLSVGGDCCTIPAFGAAFRKFGVFKDGEVELGNGFNVQSGGIGPFLGHSWGVPSVARSLVAFVG